MKTQGQQSDVLFLSGSRTGFGSFGGTLKDLTATTLGVHAAHVQHYVDMGFDEIHVHNVGRNQAEFIEAFGSDVLPRLRLDS